MPCLSRLIVLAATLAYPFAVYFGFGRVEPFWLALGLAGLGLLRAWAGRDPTWLFAALGAALLAMASLLGNSWLPVKLYPAAVSATMLAVFGASIVWPPTVIERIARLADPQLSAAGVVYTRSVTIVWCVFFACNGSVAAATALWASNEAWLLYNGLVAYLLMGALFAGEWLVRRRIQARQPAAPLSGQAHV